MSEPEIDLSRLEDAEVYQSAHQAHAGIALLARKHPSIFNEYVLRDEETGDPIENTLTHEKWHKIITRNNRVILLCHIEGGKTSQITIGRTLWQIGRNPNMRGLILSRTEAQAIKPVRTIKRYIEDSPECHAAYPDLKRSEPWQETKITVDRSRISKDPTLQAMGVNGSVIGSRLDYVVCDDLLDHENTRTRAQLDEVWDCIHATVMGRLTRGAKMVITGTAWDIRDVQERLARRKGWVSMRSPAIDAKKKPTSPRWSAKRLKEAKEKDFTDLEWRRQILVLPRDDSESAFKQDYINRCLKRGEGLALMPNRAALADLVIPGKSQMTRMTENGIRWDKKPRMIEDAATIPIFSGLDLAAKRTKRAARTVFFTLAILPNEDRLLLWIEGGKFDGPEIVERIIDHRDRYAGITMVENNSTQDWIMQFTTERAAVPIAPFTTGSNKAHPQFGVESLATEFHQGKWIIPNIRGQCDPEVEEWLTALRYHDPSEHTPDSVMASWFAREAARRMLSRGRRRGVGAFSIG